MDPIDEKIFNLLKDGKPREFKQLLSIIGHSHNTLRLHLDSLADRGLIVKDKQTAEERGRPRFTYSARAALSRYCLTLVLNGFKPTFPFSANNRAY
jgi:predicted ArsR family transcriptional regulator